MRVANDSLQPEREERRRGRGGSVRAARAAARERCRGRAERRERDALEPKVVPPLHRRDVAEPLVRDLVRLDRDDALLGLQARVLGVPQVVRRAARDAARAVHRMEEMERASGGGAREGERARRREVSRARLEVRAVQDEEGEREGETARTGPSSPSHPAERQKRTSVSDEPGTESTFPKERRRKSDDEEEQKKRKSRTASKSLATSVSSLASGYSMSKICAQDVVVRSWLAPSGSRSRASEREDRRTSS